MKLNDNLIAATSPLCDAEQTVTGGNFRISVLTSELIRVEVNDEGKFLDLATQSIWFRNLGKVQYEVKEEKNRLYIITDKITLCFSKSAGKVLYIQFKDSKKKIKCTNRNNLKGTARTLDYTFGAKPLRNGIMSTEGVAVFNDSKSLVLDTEGTVKPRENKARDIYIFAYGRNYRRCLKDFFALTGKVPFIPRFALSNWWSRYRAYTQQEYIDLMQNFIDRDIPITVATVDMDWHWVKVNKKFGTNYRAKWSPIEGWTGYSWNTDLFPDYKGFLRWLQDNNFKVTLNLHPADGVRPFEDMYKEMCAEMGINPDEKKIINFNIADPKFINAYFKVLHHPYEKEGVDFWWIDWQQGKRSAMKGLDPLWSLNHYHFLDNEKDRRPLILSRYAGVGSHRYPLGFSGDTAMNWNVLKFQPYFTLTASNIGYTWWSHDIGGHHFGRRDDELYLRWVQFGIFSPILRLHSTSNDLLGKEPWNYRKDVEIFTVEQLRLRHRMLPYIYSMNYKTHTEGLPLIEPMYYAHPEDEEAYSVRNQYYFGSELIVCPITRKINKKLNRAFTDVWLPEGRWTDIFTGTIYHGGRMVRMFRGLESIPVLAKEGAIIPLAENKGNDWNNPEIMTINVYRGTSSFVLYEDNGIDNNYLKGAYGKTLFEVSEKDALSFVINKADGNIKVLPKKRQYSIHFKDICQATKITITVNGQPVEAITEKGSCVTVNLKDIKPSDTVTVELKDYTVKDNIKYDQAAVKIISAYQARNITKMLQYMRLRKLPEKKYIKKICKLSLPKAVKEAIFEYID